MALDVWRTRPFLPAALGRVVDRMFDESFAPFYGGRDGGASGSGQTGYQTLPVTVWETDAAFEAAMLAPGLDEQSLNVTLRDDTLSIEGELNFQVPEGARLVWQEFGPAKFRRSLRLGTAIDPAKVEAVYRNGMLLVTLPKAEQARPRQVPVRLGESATGNGHSEGSAS